MLGVILDEIKIKDEALIGNMIIDNESKIVNILIKYYDNKNDKLENKLNDKDLHLNIKENILKVMSKCDDTFTRPKWNEYITKRINKYFKDKEKYNINNELSKVNNIEIYEQELNWIKKLENKKLEKLAFVMLVYCKVNKQLKDTDSNWITYSLSNIFKEAKITGGYKEKILLLHELEKREYIKNNLSGKKVSIFIDYILDEGSKGIILNKFDGVVHYYLNYIGENWKQCVECGKWFKVRGNKQKYCVHCAKIIDKEKAKERMKKIRKS